MASEVTVWTLNRATELADLGDVKAKLEGNFFRAGFQSEAGDRTPYTVSESIPNLGTEHHQLMYEQSDFNEYFVPIEVKCIGNLYDPSGVPEGSGRDILEGIVKGHRHFPDPGKAPNLTEFWKSGVGPIGLIQMRTHPGVGYYRILDESAQETGRPNILIGYSQGGLVARYLAFLDEYVFQRKAIAGIITMHAPNYGSALANPENSQTVTDGITSVLAEVLSLRSAHYPGVYAKKASKVDFEDLDKVIDTFLSDLQHIHQGGQESLRGLMATARKWLSGLRGVDDRAFYDFSPQRYAEPFSVLSLVDQYPLQRIFHGAVVGTNGSVRSVLQSVLGLESRIKKKLIWNRILEARIFGSTLGENFDSASMAYRDQVMGGYAAQSSNVPEDIENRFSKGVPGWMIDGVIPKKAHDFVIPSASQILKPSQQPPTDRFLGNLVNSKATHESGADPEDSAGEENVRLMMSLLTRMRDRLRGELAQY